MGKIETLTLRKQSLWNEIQNVRGQIREIVNSSGGDYNADEYRELLAQLETEYNNL